MDRRLGVYLWRSSLLEQSAAGVFYRAARADLLEAEDRAIARTFAEEEVKHADLLRGLGRLILPARPDADLPVAEAIPREPLTDLALVLQSERLLFAAFDRMIALGRQLHCKEMVATYEVIRADERQHIAWGRRILAGARAEVGTAARRRAVAALRHVARDAPWRAAP